MSELIIASHNLHRAPRSLVRYEPERLEDIRLIGYTRPFSGERIDIEMVAGKTVAEILRSIGAYPYPGVWALVTVGDKILPSEWWDYCRPKPGQVLTVKIMPMGRGGMKFLAVVVGIILTWFGGYLGAQVGAQIGGAVGGAAGAATGQAVGGAIGAAIGSMVGRLIASAIVPPPTKKLPSSQLDRGLQSITGTANAINRYGPVPKVFGSPPPFYPPLITDSFTEIIGDDQYFRMCFGFFGPCKVSNFKIGDTPIDKFTGVEMEIREGWPNDPPLTLFSNDIAEERFSIQLTPTVTGQDYIYFQRRSRPDTDEISVDVICPRGLFRIDPKTGNRLQHTVAFFFQYRSVDSNPDVWNTVPDTNDDGDPSYNGMIRITHSTQSEVRRSFRVVVPHSEVGYEVRLARTTVNPNNANAFDDLYWTVLRSVSYVDPIKLPGLTKIALRIKANDQLNGVVDKFSLKAEAYQPVWDGAQWTPQLTRRAAWAWTEVLRSQYGGNERPVSDGRIDLPQVIAWAAKDEADGRPFDAIIDTRTIVSQLLRDIPAAVRARFTRKEGKYSVLFDVTQNTAAQIFTPKNSWGYRGSKSFGDQPHGWKVRFLNGASTVPIDSPEERIVLDDGYSWDYGDGKGQVDAHGNPSALPLASKFEVLELFGTTDWNWAWKDGRYHIASGRLRPEIHQINCDMEHLRCRVGDLVRLSHDVPLFGLMWGRLKSVTSNDSGEATAVVLDELVVIEIGKNYSLRIRTPEGELYQAITNVPGETDTLSFTAPIAGAIQPHQGDLAVFGETGLETAEMLVKEIWPGRNLSARLTLINYAPNIYLAETGHIPPFDPQITRPGIIVPPKPSINQVRSDESVLITNEDGSQQSRIVVTFTVPSGLAQDTYFQARWRRSVPSEGWTTLPNLPFEAREFSVSPVEDGIAYDVAVRAILKNGTLASEWAQVLGHVVIGKTTRPPDVTAFFLDGGALTWLYPNPPLDMKQGGFLIRRNIGNNISWSNATPLHTGKWKESPFSIAHLAHGLQTFLIKAVDSSDNESLNAAAVVKDLGEPVFQNVVLEDDHRERLWPGSITSGQVVGGDLVATPFETLFWKSDATLFWNTDNDALFWPDGGFWLADDTPFWKADASLFWDEVYSDLIYIAALLPGFADRGGTLILDVDANGANYNAEYAAGSDDPFWSEADENLFWNSDNNALFWRADSEFQPWVGAIDVTRQTYRFRITVPGGRQGRLKEFIIKIDAPDIEENFNDILVGVAGTRLPLAYVYRQIKSITYGLNFDSINHPNARTIETLDKDIALVGVFDDSHAPTTGIVDATVKGF